MKTWITFFLLTTIISAGIAQSPSFTTYTNPVIPGDHSDCTLTQVGNDFYTTGSSFNPTPVIYHSTDLVHWEAVAQPVSAAWNEYGDKPQGGCWGGQVVFYHNKFWHFFSHGGMWFTTADKVEGPWSMPVKVNDPPQLPYSLGYDNSIFIDNDGKWYMVVKNGQPNNGIVELGPDGQPTGIVYNLKWLNPKPFQYSWAEGPVMWKHGGYYYYSFAHDVSGGQKAMRSKILTADSAAWTKPVNFFNEEDPGKADAIFPGPNHSSAAVELKDGTSWVVHPVWARANKNEWFGQGRQGLLNQVHYQEDGSVIADYPSDKSFKAPVLPDNGIPWMVPKSDFFSSDKLNPEWSFLGQTALESWSLTERPGWIRLRPKSPSKANTIIKTDAEHNYSLITRVDFIPLDSTDEAGLRIMNGAENMFAKLYSSKNPKGEKIIVFRFDKTVFTVENPVQKAVWLKMERREHLLNGAYSSDGKKWIPVGKAIDVSSLDRYSFNYNGWCGNRQGLYAVGESADFDLYIYRDACTPILAGCPANQYGTSHASSMDDIHLLENIHSNDWALYAGVEFGNPEYPENVKQVQFEASCIAGGSVEIWLDSLDTGKKIGSCKISKSNVKEPFQKYTAKITKTEGRHDVYLRFVGSGKDELFKLKQFFFLTGK